jgi:hypothetical protein
VGVWAGDVSPILGMEMKEVEEAEGRRFSLMMGR